MLDLTRNRKDNLKQASNIEIDQEQKLKDEAEILTEQIESLKQELRLQNQELQKIEQELKYTNDELCAALVFKNLTLEEAKELAKNILENEKPVRNVLAELLSVLYNYPVQAEHLK